MEKAQEAKDYIDNVLPDEIAAINRKLDGVVENWYYEYSPARSNSPASEWISAGEEAKHEGDTFTNIQQFVDEETTPDAGKSWRWVKGSSGTYDWTPIADSDAVKALLDAAKAQDTADGKRRVFVDTPFTPYDRGDLWVQGGDGDIMRCILSRSSGAFDNSDWDKASKYTDDTLAGEVRDRLDDWSSDGYISPPEKAWLSDRSAEIKAEYMEINVQAAGLGIRSSDEFQAYNAAYAKVVPVLIKYTAPEPENIPVEDDYANIGLYYDSRTEILNLISATTNEALGSAKETAEEAAAKLEGFTKIEGGLIFSNILKLMEVDGTETSGLSGITKDGDGNYLPFAWAGGTYKEAQDGDAVVIIWHDGRAKFGVAEIDPYGRFIVRTNPLTPYTPQKECVVITNESIMTEQELKDRDVNEEVSNDSFTRIGATSGSSYHDLPNVAEVSHNGTKLTISAVIHANAVIGAGNTPTFTVSTGLLLMKDGEQYAVLGAVSSSDSDATIGNKQQTINESFNVPVGTYRLRVTCSFVKGPLSVGGASVVLSSVVDESVMRMRYNVVRTMTVLGNNGFMLSYNAKNFLRASASGNMQFTLRTGLGYIDVPGVLAAGQVSTTGSISNKWGCKSGLFSAEWGSLGTAGWCTVTHNFGHTSYHVMVTMAADGCTGYIQSRYSNNFTVVVKKNGTAAAAAFYFIVVGDNRPSLNA